MMYKWKSSLFTLLLVGALGFIFLTTDSAHAACPDDIISYWRLDDDGTYPDSVNGNDGAGNANPTFVVGGLVNGAQDFNGINDRIEIPADGSFGWGKEESFTIEVWMKNTVNPGGSEVFVGRDGTVDSLQWWVGIRPTGYAAFNLIATNGDGQLIEGSLAENSTPLADGDWHHVVAVRDASTGENRLYVDGQLDIPAVAQAYAAGFDSVTAADVMNIGGFPGGNFFDGMLDEAAIYNRALSLAEIQAHYNNRIGQDYCAGAGGGGTSDAPFPEETISYWKLDDDGTYPDSFNGNDGTGSAPPVFEAEGLVNGAQDFDGINDRIEIPADGSFGWGKEESFTIEVWMKNTVNPGGSEVFVGRDGTVDSLQWWVGIRPTGYAAFNLIATNGDGQLIEGSLAENSTPLADGDWHHVVAVRDASTGENRLYVDGQLDIPAVAQAYAAGFDSVTAADVLNIGAFPTGNHFEGTLDEVALYNRALSLAEIEQHYDSGLAGRGIDNLITPAVPSPSAPTTSSGGGGGCFIATAAE